MTRKGHISRSTKVFIALTALYALLSFILPPSDATKAAYQLDDLQYHILLFIVRLPIIAVWCVALFSYISLHHYAEKITDTTEGDGFRAMATGMRWIAWGLLVPALASAFLNAIANVHPGFSVTALVTTNYLYVIGTLLAFSYFNSGAHSLAQNSNIHFSSRHIRLLTGVLVSISVLFCFLVASKMHGMDLGDSYNAYYLPNIIIWITVVVPYLYAWFLGAFAVTELILIAQRTSGVIYKKALQLLASGMVLIIFSLGALQYFRSIIPRTGHLTIGSALITAYAIYALLIVGSVMLAIGARRLKRIEDI